LKPQSISFEKGESERKMFKTTSRKPKKRARRFCGKDARTRAIEKQTMIGKFGYADAGRRIVHAENAC